tara:strand:- start:4372 stop:5940 length:1569 start_codon:yes stop_codon:yes gene_type:complete
MSSLTNALNLIETITTGIWRQDDLEEKYQAAENQQQNHFELQQLSKNLDREYSQEQQLVMNEYTQGLKDIHQSLYKLNLYGLTETELKNNISSDGKHTTKDAEALMEDYNVELKNGYFYQANDLNDKYDYFDTVRKASEKNREIMGVLNNMTGEIDKLPNYYAKAGTEQGIKNVVDIMDLEAMIDNPEYRNVFKKEVDDPLNEGKKIWVDNYLATAFKTPQGKDAKIGRYGSKIEYTNQELMARGIDPGTYLPTDDANIAKFNEIKLDETAQNNLYKQRIGNYNTSDYNLVAERVRKKGYSDISGLKIQSFKEMGYNLEKNQQQKWALYDKLGKNIQVMTSHASDHWWDKPLMNEWQKNSDQWYGDDYSSVNRDPVEFWIGKKGKEGALIKNTNKNKEGDPIGKWYVDEAALTATSLNATHKAMLKRDLEFAKDLQENAIDSGGWLSEEQKKDMMFVAGMLKQGNITTDEASDYQNMIIANPGKTSSNNELMEQLMKLVQQSDSTKIDPKFKELIHLINSGK